MHPRRTSSDIDLQSTVEVYSPSADETDRRHKPWYSYIPLAGTIFFILAPQPSLLIVLINYYLLTREQHLQFVIHLLTTYTLTFLAFTSLIVCVARDPGPVTIDHHSRRDDDEDEDGDEQIGMTEALMSSDFDFMQPGRWCRKCWAPKPERTHHCSECGRCVLKMDHHCPWLGARCIGHRTYPAFLHFLLCVTLLALYITVICILALLYSFNNPYQVDPTTPVHELILTLAGIIFTLVIGSFLCYHIYLVGTNQTTLENLSPFLLLRHLPPIPPGDHGLSDPPLEPELSYAQRRLVRDAHGYIRLYDLGWRQNFKQVLGWKRRWGWVQRVFLGGATPGDGKTFPRNPRSDDLLQRLANELAKADSMGR